MVVMSLKCAALLFLNVSLSCEKLQEMSANISTVSGISWQTGERTQSSAEAREQSSVGNVLSPSLFTFCRSQHLHTLWWLCTNHLLLNMNKIREMMIDFRRTRVPLRPSSLLGCGGGEQAAGRPHRLKWKSNTDAVYGKLMSWSHCGESSIREGGSVAEPVVERRPLSQLGPIMDNPEHPLLCREGVLFLSHWSNSITLCNTDSIYLSIN